MRRKGFTLVETMLSIAIFSMLMAGLMTLGWLITDYGDKKIGTWFEILGGIALVVGALMLQRERNTGAIG